MGAVATPDDDTALPARVWLLEREQVTIGDKLAKVDDVVVDHGELLATHTTLLSGLRDDVVSLKESVDRGVWALVSLCFTIAGSSALVAYFG